MYLPFHNESETKYYIKIPSKLCYSAVSIPLFAFISCVVITMYKDFESANSTHCKVPNIFPSISASIGNYEPQSTIWKTAIYAHAPIRFYLLYLRWNYYRSIVLDSCVIIVKLAVFLNIIENLALLGLTHWTSSKNYCKYCKIRIVNWLWNDIELKMLIFSQLIMKYVLKCLLEHQYFICS